MDIKTLASEGQHVMGVLANHNGRDILLVELDAAAVPEAEVTALRSAGFFYAGAVGCIAGQPEIVMAEVLPPDTMFALGAAYRNHVRGQSGDSVKGLRDLYEKPDTRIGGEA